jgi:hypothetical protein
LGNKYAFIYCYFCFDYPLNFGNYLLRCIIFDSRAHQANSSITANQAAATAAHLAYQSLNNSMHNIQKNDQYLFNS